MKRRYIAGIVILVAAALFGVAYVAFGVDVEAVRAAHDQRFIDDAFAGKRPVLDIENVQRALRPFHKGEPPCAFYGDGPKVGNDEVEMILGELAAAGVLEKTFGTSSIWMRWGREDERRRHGPVTDEEILTQWRLTSTTWENVVAFFASGGVVKAIRDNTERMEKREGERAESQLATLSEAERNAMRAVWERHSYAMSGPAQLISVFSRLRDRDNGTNKASPARELSPTQREAAKECTSFPGGSPEEMRANIGVCELACAHGVGDTRSCEILDGGAARDR